MLARFTKLLNAPRDIASLALFRVLFGTLMSVSALRFMANGWVERFYGERTFFFKYWGFSWVEPLSVSGMYAVYATLALLGALIAVGLFYRLAIVLFFLVFSYAELTDVTNYLNHYYLVSLLSLLCCFLPLNASFSLDVKRGALAEKTSLPAWMLYLLRFQVATVYFYAALAKCVPDFLFYGQPLNLWLSAHIDLPVIGPWLQYPIVAVLASWGGFLHDLLIVPSLLWKRSRPYAYGFLLFFHIMTSTWFNIGIFPVLMPMAATLFFEPDFPRRLFTRVFAKSASAPAGPSFLAPRFGLTLGLLAAYCVFQVSMPLRTHLYGGNVLWHEQGMRFSWRVMLRDKHGAISYRVRLENGREGIVPPRRYLTSEQEREMSGQPDLILQLAHHIARDFAARGHANVSVFADAFVSLNGREPVRMIDPRVDLAQVDDDVSFARWILPAPTEPPVHLVPSARYASAGL